MADQTDNLQQALQVAIRRFLPQANVRNLKRLTGGANQKMWSLDAVTPDQSTGLILRQASDWKQGSDETLALDNEVQLLTRAAEHVLPVPAVYCVLTPENGLGWAV
jgi:aminoglycoside phosphotransferase (APT) family kinase protein